MPHRIAEHLQRMLDSTEGVVACALVDATSGLVWHRCGPESAGDETLWEAAVDYWRLYGRQRGHFEVLGELGAAVMYHQHGVLAVLPCRHETELLMVCRAEHQAVDWRGWQRRVRKLALEIEDLI